VDVAGGIARFYEQASEGLVLLLSILQLLLRAGVPATLELHDVYLTVTLAGVCLSTNE
jgi:hypothetical protein